MKSLLYITLMVSFNFCMPSMAIAKENATWIKSTFFRGIDPSTKKKLTNKDTEDLAQRLKTEHIHYAYMFAGPYESDGHLPRYAFSRRAREAIKILKQIYPELKVFPWVGGIQNKTVQLERADWVKNAIADTVKLVKMMPIDGVHLDFEYVLFPDKKFNHKKLSTENYGEHWVAFHRQMRLILPNVFISTVVVSTASGTKPWKHKHLLSEIKEVSSVINQMSFMFYETSLHEIKSYKANLKEQLEQIKNLKSMGPNSPQYLIGIGTFREQKKLRSYLDLGFENIPAALNLLRELEREVDQKKPIIDGLAIYCEWMTTDQEWGQLRNYLK